MIWLCYFLNVHQQPQMTSEAVSDLICGQYCKNIMIVNDTFSVVRSDAPSCGIVYDHHSDS
jgi:hypothetical protein